MPKPFASRKYAREDFEKAIETCDTIRDVLLTLKLNATGGNYIVFYRTAAKFGIDVSRFRHPGKNDNSPNRTIRNSISDQRFKESVKKHQSYMSILKSFELNINSGTNNKWVRDKISQLKLNTSHFTGQGHLKGKTHDWGQPTPLKDILVENSDYSGSNNLKKRLFKAGLLEKQCVECGLMDTWNGKPITLQIDHINGVNNDNRIENLRILCPNCHSQTETFCSRNTTKRCGGCNKKLGASRKTGLCRECLDAKKVDIKSAKINHCNECNIVIGFDSEVCKECYNKHRAKYQDMSNVKYKIIWPSDKALLKLVKKTNYLQAGKTLGVSDNAIRSA